MNGNEVTLEDPTLLLVAGRGDRDKKENKLYIQKLANAVVKVVEKYQVANLRCIGADSVNNGVKAFMAARTMIENHEDESKRVRLNLDPDFVNVDLNGSEITSIVFKVQP